MKMKIEMNGDFVVAEANKVFLRDTSFAEKLGDCGVCLAYREIVADGCSSCLPVSGEIVIDKLDKWWNLKGSSPDHGPERFVRTAELPMCQACLDLAEDIEQIEYSFDNRLKSMWARLRAGKLVVPDTPNQEDAFNDVIQAAAMAAGIFDDPGSTHTPGNAHVPQLSPQTEKPTRNRTPSPAPSPLPPPPPEIVAPVETSASPTLVVRKVAGRRTSVRNATKRGSGKDENQIPEQSENGESLKRATRASRRTPKKSKGVVDEEQEKGEKNVAPKEEVVDVDYGTIVVTRVKQEPEVYEEELFPDFPDIPDEEIGDSDDLGEWEKKTPPKKRRTRRATKRKANPEGASIDSAPATGDQQETPKQDRRKSSKWYNTERMCPICGLILKAGGNHAVEKHISVVHNRDKTLTCQFCPEKFTYHENLYAHQAKVHQYKTERIAKPCEHCGKVITSRWGMRQHLLNVHGILREGHKVYECPRCQRKFLSLRNFKDHVNSHDGVRPYGCPLCEVRMVKFDNLRQHVKRVHKKDVRLVRDTDAAGGAACELVLENGEIDSSSAALQARMIEAQVVGASMQQPHLHQQQHQILHEMGTITPKIEDGVQIVEISGLQLDPNTHHVILEEVMHDGADGQSVQTQTIIVNPLHAVG